MKSSLSCDADVLVIGGGNAALCAALMAREAGASVWLLEAAPIDRRGGNSSHTRNRLRLAQGANQFQETVTAAALGGAPRVAKAVLSLVGRRQDRP